MQEHERWLKIVADDLNSAKKLLEAEIFSTSIYHCQQAAEKALKAYLAFGECKILKIHDLVRLVELCCNLDTDFERMYDYAESLNPFSTKFRYPTEFDIPDYEDTKKAIEQTERVVNFVLGKIEQGHRGQQEMFK